MIAGATDSDCYAGHKENGHDGDDRRDTDDSDGVGDNGEVMALVAEVKAKEDDADTDGNDGEGDGGEGSEDKGGDE